MFERARKGMWNGGKPPFGYERKNKKLVVNKKEERIHIGAVGCVLSEIMI